MTASRSRSRTGFRAATSSIRTPTPASTCGAGRPRRCSATTRPAARSTFRTRPGGEIDGVEYGVDVGSFNYLNNYSTAGVKGANYEGSIFLSDVRGDGWYGYSQFNTQTANMLLTVQASPWDKITFKAIDNELDTQLPFRMSLNQFNLNPFQQGCATAATAAPGCAVNNFSATNTNPRVPQTAAEAGANRDDRRSIGGVRWEHDFDDETTGRVQIVVDDRNISQPTGTTSAIGDYLSYNVITDVTHRETFMGLPARYLAGRLLELPSRSTAPRTTSRREAGRRSERLQSKTEGSTTNFGARARQEVAVGGGVDRDSRARGRADLARRVAAKLHLRAGRCHTHRHDRRDRPRHYQCRAGGWSAVAAECRSGSTARVSAPATARRNSPTCSLRRPASAATTPT